MELFQSDLNEELPVIEEDDEFYEDIEAPKFVDLTAPDRNRPDDKSWFCLRIGCDQQHEEVDPDALYRSFKLRVMAARSPNIKLQRALNRQSPSYIRSMKKCPRSAPAKSVKDRASRVSTITSVPCKMAKSRLTQQPVSSLRSTPNRTKPTMEQSTSEKEKALTTPRTRKNPSNHEQFRSVKHQREPVAAPKNRSVAKALFIGTPKKNDEDGKTLVTEVYDGMKKLNIGTVKKHTTSMCLKKIYDHPDAAISSAASSEECKENTQAVAMENVAQSDDNKENDSSTSNCTSSTTNSESESLQLENSENIPQKGVRHPSKCIRENGTQAGKVKRTTNPKPFRLRTDERGILKEANLEKKMKIEALQEIVPVLGKKVSVLHKGKPAHESNNQLNSDGGQKSQSNKSRTPRARFVESRYATSIPKCYKLEKKETEESQNKIAKMASSRQILQAQSATAARKVQVSRLGEKGALATKPREDDNKMVGATSLKEKKPSTIKRANSHRSCVPKDCTRGPEMTMQ